MGQAGYGEQNKGVHTPRGKTGGVWEAELSVLYPAGKDKRGMESGIKCSIPRGEERAGYGEQKQVFHTPQSEKIARIEHANGEKSRKKRVGSKGIARKELKKLEKRGKRNARRG